MSRSGMLIGMFRVSCRPIEFYLLRGLDGARTTTLRNRSVDMSVPCSRACRAGVATYGVKQLHTESNSRHRNSTIISRSQKLGYKRAGPSGLAELEQLHVESNSQCNRHVYLSSTFANSHLARDLSYS